MSLAAGGAGMVISIVGTLVGIGLIGMARVTVWLLLASFACRSRTAAFRLW